MTFRPEPVHRHGSPARTAVVAYYWALVPFRRWGWLVAFLFVVCAATRLARFNIQIAAVDKRYFVGLSSPAAAGLVAMLVYAAGDSPERAWAGVVFAVAVTAAALLMVSRLRYRSFKDLNLKDRRSSIAVIVVALLIAVIVAEPSALAALAVVYALSAPLAALFALFTRGRFGREGAPPEVPDGPPLR
jgi:CDP-diacylglycerol--serine O-phosphatidyltransferase